MSLSKDDITNVERGIDAAIAQILEMAQKAMVSAQLHGGAEASGHFVGFLQALNEHRHLLANMALERALIAHPDLDEAAVDVAQEMGAVAP